MNEWMNEWMNDEWIAILTFEYLEQSLVRLIIADVTN